VALLKVVGYTGSALSILLLLATVCIYLKYKYVYYTVFFRLFHPGYLRMAARDNKQL